MDPQIITVAFILGYLAYRIGLPPLVGFLLAGLGLNLAGFTSTPMLSTLADMGVTLLLFTIGLKLDIKSLLKPEVWASATLHIGLTVGCLGSLLLLLSYSGLQFFLGLDIQTSLLIAFGLSFSSTVFAVKVLEEDGRMDSLNGRTAIGVLIIQDIVAVVYLTISSGKTPSYWAILLIAMLPLARKLFLIIMDKIGHGELQILFGLFLALSAGAAAFEMVGLKADLGALILGILVAPHPRAKELANSLMNIKDLLLIGFFIDIGLTGFPDGSGMLAAIVLVALLPIKLLLYFVLFTRFKLKARTSFITTMNLGNYSEFGLIVCSMAVTAGSLDKSWLVVMAISLSLSLILASSLGKSAETMFEKYKSLFKKFETIKRHPEELPLERGSWEIVVIGMGRIGIGAYDTFQERYGNVVLGVDYSPIIVAEQNAIGRSVIQGDVTDPDYYRRLPKTQQSLRLVILAMPSLETKIFVAKVLNKRGFKGSIAAVAQYDDEVGILQEAGVDTAFNMYSEAGAGLAAHICMHLEELENNVDTAEVSVH